MKIYTVDNESYYSLNAAKKAMRATGARGYITKVYSNGDWMPCGEISLSRSNKTFVANTRQRVKSY